MSTAEKTQWRITGHEIVCCNCDWGCPCQFNAPPTTGNCEAFIGYEIADGHYGGTTLDGARWAASSPMRDSRLRSASTVSTCSLASTCLNRASNL